MVRPFDRLITLESVILYQLFCQIPNILINLLFDYSPKVFLAASNLSWWGATDKLVYPCSLINFATLNPRSNEFDHATGRLLYIHPLPPERGVVVPATPAVSVKRKASSMVMSRGRTALRGMSTVYPPII